MSDVVPLPLPTPEPPSIESIVQDFRSHHQRLKHSFHARVALLVAEDPAQALLRDLVAETVDTLFSLTSDLAAAVENISDDVQELNDEVFPLKLNSADVEELSTVLATLIPTCPNAELRERAQGLVDSLNGEDDEDEGEDADDDGGDDQN